MCKLIKSYLQTVQIVRNSEIVKKTLKNGRKNKYYQRSWVRVPLIARKPEKYLIPQGCVLGCALPSALVTLFLLI